MTKTPLKLIAFDAEDLAVMSAHMQDAVVRAADLTFLPREKRFAFVAERYNWDVELKEHKHHRCSTGFHFEGVRAVRSRNLPQDKSQCFLNLLAVTFEFAEAPAGMVMLHFSDSIDICLEVDYLEAAMQDIGQPRSASCCPHHVLDEDQ